VLIYGAGDGGELLARELFNNSALLRVPVGFVDDDRRKVGKMLHGLRIHSSENLGRLCDSLNATEILMSTSKMSLQRMREIVDECRLAGVHLGRLNLEIQTIADDDFAWVLPSGSVDAATLPLVKDPAFSRARADKASTLNH
jgi:FlaA1/EpsC-like NDP-sugar epimerase